jgi:hypothetical protein
LNNDWHGSLEAAGLKKGEEEMSNKSQLSRTVVAIVAALAMSSVTVGAAVGPAQANAATGTVPTVLKAPINA